MFRHRVIMGTYKGNVPEATMADSMKEGKRSAIKNAASANLQQSTVEEGVELNEESKLM